MGDLLLFRLLWSLLLSPPSRRFLSILSNSARMVSSRFFLQSGCPTPGDATFPNKLFRQSSTSLFSLSLPTVSHARVGNLPGICTLATYAYAYSRLLLPMGTEAHSTGLDKTFRNQRVTRVHDKQTYPSSRNFRETRTKHLGKNFQVLEQDN